MIRLPCRNDNDNVHGEMVGSTEVNYLHGLVCVCVCVYCADTHCRLVLTRE